MRNYHTKFNRKGINYLNVLSILTLVLISVAFSGCSDDDEDDWKKTNTEGRPSKIVLADNKTLYFYYQNNQLKQRKDSEGWVVDFKYENGELVGKYSYPTDPNIADGTSGATYKRVNNKITVQSTGEPDGNFYYEEEIELNSNDLPVRITSHGYKYINNEYEVPERPLYYKVFTYDTSGKNLIKKETFELSTNKKTETYSYEYDNNKGMMSQNGLPAWYNIYTAFEIHSYTYVYLNITNNVSKINIERTNDTDPIRNKSLTYEYNNNKYPTSATATNTGQAPEKISIYY